jgi:hypothetical protein
MADSFTFDASAQLVQKLGQAILEDKAFREDNWQSIALVAQVEGAIMTHGFAYYDDGSTKAAVLSEFASRLLFKELADQMAGLNGRRWKTCLAQIKRPELKLRMTYEYDDVNRWMVTPANLKTMPKDLRPE